MKLTRRDALLALSVVGAGGVGELAGQVETTGATAFAEESVLDALTAVAEVVYPSAVETDLEFVRTYVLGRTAGREAHRRGIQTAITDLNERANSRFGRTVGDLVVDNRDQLLRETGVGRAYPQPDGTVPERIRFYVVNELLYALYTTPKGGRLLGNENPAGYPGGTEAYQRGPTE